MKMTVALFLLWFCVVACHQDTGAPGALEFNQLPKRLKQDLLVVLETKQYIVLTPVNGFLASVGQWVHEHTYIIEDKELLAAVQQVALAPARPRGLVVLRADSVATTRSLGSRLAYRTSDLLRANKCWIYNKQHKRIEPTCREYVVSPVGYEGHGFTVSTDTLMELVDKIY